jgi:hypothetical protein
MEYDVEPLDAIAGILEVDLCDLMVGAFLMAARMWLALWADYLAGMPHL